MKPLARRARPGPLLALLALALAAGGVLVAAGATSRPVGAATPQRLVIYSIAKQQQFINNADDRTRGVGTNPFGNFKDLAPVAKGGNGPFAGDEALFSFNLYTDANLTRRAGAAIFTCHYNFDKNAFCDASFRLSNGGTLLASGGFNFNATRFTLPVTGGYGRYIGASGVLEETPSAKHAQRLVFTFG